ncbi:hypothetical protein [Methylococcus sp. Mc7]|uniref:hypothetical protein n=1 Tax=Methylococcus sp. Mc7 TaxID=2860258 RepID=UPI001C52E33B|nr:hypothetical protein [Methylococcus sp. Mc7]QXP85474.1 hypothetical protein KW115_07120 [Methylococcus sp. Mc7]
MGLYDRDWYRESQKKKADWENAKSTYERGVRRHRRPGLGDFAIAIGALFVAIGLINIAKSPRESMESLTSWLRLTPQPIAAVSQPAFRQNPPIEPQAGVSPYRERSWSERDPAPPQVTTVIHNHIHIQQAPPAQTAAAPVESETHRRYLKLKEKEDRCLYWKKHLARYDRNLANTNIDLYCR